VWMRGHVAVAPPHVTAITHRSGRGAIRAVSS
jgi:hypothetical protein